MTFAKYPVTGGGGGGSGDVVGPASATDSAVVLFDGTTGKLIKNSTLSASTIVQTTGIQSIDGVKTFIASSTVFSGTVTINNSTPLLLGSSPNRVSLVPGTRSVAASWTFPDIGDCTFAALEGTQSFLGAKTFATITLPSAVTYTSNGTITKSGVGGLTLTNASNAGLTFAGTGTVTAPTGTYTLAGLSLSNVFTVAQTVSATTNQIVLGTTNTTTINSAAPAASRTYNIIDAGGAADFVMTAANQTIGGTKTFSSAVTINPASNQLVLASGVNQLTLNSSTSAAARTYSFPDVGTTGSVAMLEGAQTFSGLKTFSAGVAITGGTAATQRLTVSGTTWTVGNGPTITEAGAATFATSVTSPLIVGGSSVSQVLTIKSTTGIGTSDRIDLVVGNNGAVTGLSVGTVGQVTAGPTGSVSTSLQHVLNLPNANSYSNISSTGVNSIRLAASANTNAIISGRSTTNNIAGLAFVAGTADTNSVADMYFQVLENDNTDFATQTNLAFAWYNGSGSSIMTGTRAGSWSFGPSSGSTHTSHRFISRVTNAATTDAIVISQFNIDGDATGGRYFQCQNSAGTEVGRIEAATATTTTFTGSSDKRLKQKPSSFEGLSKVLQMQPREFEWISNPGKRDKGFYAQELYEVYPEAVSVGTDALTESGALKTPWGIDYGRLTPVLVRALQELHAELQALKRSA